MSELPLGWTTAAIRQLCTLENGRAFKSSDWTQKGLPIVRIQNLNRQGASFNHFAGEVDERYRLRGGELLFAWSGTPGTSFGAHVWRGRDAVLNQHIFRVDFDDSVVEKRFFRYAINQKLEELIDVAHGGVGLRHVTKGVFENTEVVVPPLPEQKRIADKLDAVLARVDACRERLDRVPGILKRFRQSVLAAATSGELTREWRGGADAQWGQRSIEELCLDERYALAIGPFGSNLKVADYRGEGVPLIFVRDVRARNFGHAETKYVTQEKAAELKAHAVRPGDLLITKMGDPPGDTAIYPRNRPPAIMTADVVCMRVDPHTANTEFLGYVIESPLGRERIDEITAGVAQQKISLERFRTMLLPMPPLPEQVEIARRVGELFELADRLGCRVSTARDSIARSTPCALAKAFRGELVPQDPNDEPASVRMPKLTMAQKRTAAEQPRRRPRTLGKQPIMSNSDKDFIKAAILKLQTDRFSFDELRVQVSGDYESLKAALFELLEEPNPVVRQVFDKRAMVVQLVRVRL